MLPWGKASCRPARWLGQVDWGGEAGRLGWDGVGALGWAEGVMGEEGWEDMVSSWEEETSG